MADGSFSGANIPHGKIFACRLNCLKNMLLFYRPFADVVQVAVVTLPDNRVDALHGYTILLTPLNHVFH